MDKNFQISIIVEPAKDEAGNMCAREAAKKVRSAHGNAVNVADEGQCIPLPHGRISEEVACLPANIRLEQLVCAQIEAEPPPRCILCTQSCSAVSLAKPYVAQ